MTVVDTAIWIDFLEARGTPFDIHLGKLIATSAPLALTDIIYCEVLQGIVDDLKFRRTRNTLKSYPILRVRGLMTFEHAAQICRAVDCLIAAICLENGTDLYQNDRDFVIISTVRGLRLSNICACLAPVILCAPLVGQSSSGGASCRVGGGDVWRK